jgi:hypothetical protein
MISFSAASRADRIVADARTTKPKARSRLMKTFRAATIHHALNRLAAALEAAVGPIRFTSLLDVE